MDVDGELASVRWATVTSSCFVLVKVRRILRGLVLEHGMVGTKFPVVEEKTKNEKEINWSWWVADSIQSSRTVLCR